MASEVAPAATSKSGDPAFLGEMLESTDLASLERHPLLGSMQRLWLGVCWALDALGRVRPYVLNLVLALIGLMLAYAIGKALLEDKVAIEPISVPRNLERAGYSGIVVTRRLIDEIQAIGRTATTRKDRVRFGGGASGNELPEIELPSTGISLPSLVSIIRSLLDRRQQTISGEVLAGRSATAEPTKNFVLSLRLSSPVGEVVKPIEGDNIDEIVRASARSIVEKLDPVVLASYLYEVDDHPQLDRLIKRLLTSGIRGEKKWGLLFSGLRSDDREQARGFFEKAIAEDSTFVAAYVDLGIVFEALGNYPGARRNFDLAIALKPDFVPAYNARGHLFNTLLEYDSALKDFDRAIELDRQFVLAFSNRGNARSAKRQYDKAIEDYDWAIRLAPTFATVFSDRGNAYFGKGENDQALRDYEQAIRLAPTLAAAYSGRGVIYSAEGRFDLALSDFNQAINLDPNKPSFFNNRGLAYQENGEQQRAIDDFDRAIGLDPKDAVAFLNRGISHRKLGQYREALRDHEKATSLDPTNAANLSERCLDKAILGVQLESAIADCDEALRLRPDDVWAHDSRGFAHLKLGQFKLAIGDYNTALAKSVNPFSLFGRGVAKRGLNDTAGSDEDIGAAKRLYGDIESVMAQQGLKGK
jgi:tetratricopeptide (TPR) repeat protein